MRRIFPLIVLTMHLLSATLNAQAPCPPKVIEDCPDAGCAGWDKQLNIKKNLRSAPAQQTPRRMTLAQIIQLDYPAQWYSGKDRRELEALGEGMAVQVTAYLVEVKDGDATSANCKLSDPRSVNNLLTLVSKDALGKKKFNRAAPSVTAEITARVRLMYPKLDGDKISNWTKKKLDVLIRSRNGAVLVKITGLLLLDTEHIYNPLVRYTDWEIHPVLEIEVCSKDECTSDGGWKKLDDMTIKIPVRTPSAAQKGPRFQTKH